MNYCAKFAGGLLRLRWCIIIKASSSTKAGENVSQKETET